MRIAINGNRFIRPGSLPVITAHAESAVADGYGGYWLAQDPTGPCDALTALTAIAPSVRDVELGTAVVPTWPRHPAVLAAHALTAHQATGERLTLGLGLSHPAMMRAYGIDTRRPVAHLEEYLSILLPLLAGQSVDVAGEWFSCRASMEAPVARPPDVLLAALGPKMLDLAGRVSAGTITTWTGPRTIREHVRPLLDEAAAGAGRERQRLVAIVSVAVTDDTEAARQSIDSWFALHGDAPSYRKTLEREQVARPSDVQAVGDEEQVLARLVEFRDAGVDDLVVGEVIVEDRDQERLRALIASGSVAAL